MTHDSLHLVWTVFRTSSETFPTVKPPTHTHKHKDVAGLQKPDSSGLYFITPPDWHLFTVRCARRSGRQGPTKTVQRAEIFGAIPKETNSKISVFFYMCVWVNCLTRSTNKVVSPDSHHWMNMNICMKKCQYSMLHMVEGLNHQQVYGE